jgi:hypothetical protein
MMPACISSVTASPASRIARTTCASGVGWPANGISNVGVKIHVRGRARRRQDERRLDRLNCSARACIVVVIDAAGVLEHRERIAGERRFGEDVDDPVRVDAWSRFRR